MIHFLVGLLIIVWAGLLVTLPAWLPALLDIIEDFRDPSALG